MNVQEIGTIKGSIKLQTVSNNDLFKCSFKNAHKNDLFE